MKESSDRILTVQMTESEYQDYKKQKDIIKELVSVIENLKSSRVEEDPRFQQMNLWFKRSIEEVEELKEANKILEEAINKKGENIFLKFLRWFSK